MTNDYCAVIVQYCHYTLHIKHFSTIEILFDYDVNESDREAHLCWKLKFRGSLIILKFI